MTASSSEENDSTSATNQKEEDVMDLVKGEGPWQRWMFVIIFLYAIPDGSHNMVMTFFTPEIDYWCARPLDVNISVEKWKTVALPPNDKQCSRYKFFNQSYIYKGEMENNSVTNKEIETCDSWEYDHSFYASTVVTKWNLVCDKEWLISMSKSIFVFGNIISATLLSYFADKFGRKPIILICSILSIVSAITCAFSSSFIMFAVARLFIAVGVTGADIIAFVLLMEIIGPERRAFYGIGVNFGWILGYFIPPGIAWLLRDWFWMQIVLTMPCIILLLLWWLLPESPRWLLSHRKKTAALKVLSRAAKMNGSHCPKLDAKLEEIISKTNKKCEKQASSNILQLFKPGLWQKTIVLFYVWCVVAFMYYGISYNTNELAGDPFLNYILYGVVEILAYIMAFFFIQSKGRKYPVVVTLMIAGASCLLIYPIPDDPTWMRTVMHLLGKLCITCSFAIIYVFTAEIFPTVVRSIGLGSSCLGARLGSIIAPFVRELGRAIHPIVPQIIFGILAAVAGILVLLLPETKDCNVPDTVEDAVGVSRNRSSKNEA